MEPNASEEEPRPRERSSMGLALAAIAAIGASAVGAFLYQGMQGQAKSSIDVSGFDVAQVEAPKQRPAVAVAQAAPGSSLNMISGGGGLSFGRQDRSAQSSAPAPEAPAAPAPESSFTQMCRANEERIHRLTLAYMKTSPVFKRYGEDWMRHPDLKKLNDDYMRNHDPVAFMRGLARSQSFPQLVKKYANDPHMQAYVKDVIAKAPGGMINSGLAVVKKDGVVERLMDNVMAAMGLPTGMFAAYGGSSGGKQIDEASAMQSMMGNNPDLQKAMGAMNDPQMQKALQSNPEAAAKLKGLQSDPEAMKMLGGSQQKR